MFWKAEVRQLDRSEAHLLLDEVLDGAATASTLPGSAGSGVMPAWRQLTDVVDGAALQVLPGWERSGDWVDDGAVSVAQWFTSQTGTSRPAAGSFRKLALALAQRPHVGEATVAGRLSMAHARELVAARRPDVIEAFDRDEADLAATAATLTYEELRIYLLNWRYAVLEAAARNEHERPVGPESDADRISLHHGFAGRGILDGDLTAESAATLRGAIDAEVATLRREGALEGDSLFGAELEALAVMNIIRRGTDAGTSHGSTRPSLVALADLDTLLHRTGDAPEQQMTRRAEILGAGPVPDAVIASSAATPR